MCGSPKDRCCSLIEFLEYISLVAGLLASLLVVTSFVISPYYGFLWQSTGFAPVHSGGSRFSWQTLITNPSARAFGTSNVAEVYVTAQCAVIPSNSSDWNPLGGVSSGRVGLLSPGALWSDGSLFIPQYQCVKHFTALSSTFTAFAVTENDIRAVLCNNACQATLNYLVTVSNGQNDLSQRLYLPTLCIAGAAVFFVVFMQSFCRCCKFEVGWIISASLSVACLITSTVMYLLFPGLQAGYLPSYELVAFALLVTGQILFVVQFVGEMILLYWIMPNDRRKITKRKKELKRQEHLEKVDYAIGAVGVIGALLLALSASSSVSLLQPSRYSDTTSGWDTSPLFSGSQITGSGAEFEWQSESQDGRRTWHKCKSSSSPNGSLPLLPQPAPLSECDPCNPPVVAFNIPYANPWSFSNIKSFIFTAGPHFSESIIWSSQSQPNLYQCISYLSAVNASYADHWIQADRNTLRDSACDSGCSTWKKGFSIYSGAWIFYAIAAFLYIFLKLPLRVCVPERNRGVGGVIWLIVSILVPVSSIVGLIFIIVQTVQSINYNLFAYFVVASLGLEALNHVLEIPMEFQAFIGDPNDSEYELD